MEVGNPDNPLMKKLYIRAAMSEGMNRQSLIKALYGPIAPGLKPLNNPEFELGPNANGKNAYFAQYNYNPKKAIALLKKNGCTGGPSTPSASNKAVWTCGGQKTEFNFDTTTRASRQQSGAIFTAQLMAIGIKLNPTYHDASSFFGTGSKLAASSPSSAGLIVSKSLPASSVISPLLRKLAPMTSVL